MSKTIIGCPVSADLAARTRTMIDNLREDASSVDKADVVDLIAELTKASFDYHFVRPLDDLGIGFASKKGIQVSLAGVTKVIRSTLQKIVKGLDTTQFAKMADLLEDAYCAEQA